MSRLHMPKRDLNILLAFLGAVLLLLSYLFICGHYRAQEETIRLDTSMLRPTLAELQDHQLNLSYYEQETATARQTIADLRELHPDIVLPEEFIQLIVALEAQTDTDVRSIAFHDTEALSTFTLPNADGYPMSYAAYRQSFTFTALLGYEALKEVITKIYAQDERITLDSCSVAYNAEDGLLNATITVSQIFVNNGSYVYEPVIVPGGRIGTANPFNTLA
jgi:hypothetical protein